MRVNGPHRLLLISYHFPPSAEVAGKPTARLVRHLGERGWECVVLTIPQRNVAGPPDPVGYSDVLSSTRVERVAPWPTFLEAARGLKNVARMLVRRGGAPGGANANATANGGSFAGNGRRGFSDWAVRYLTFPDKQAGWIAPAIRRGDELLRRERFDAVMTVAPAYSALLVGLALRRMHPQVPWVAQLHDPWAQNPFAAKTDRFLRKCVAHLERRVVCSADDVLLATDEAAGAFVRRYPDIPSRKFAVLANGYDPADFPVTDAIPANGDRSLRFVYVGSLYSRRNPFPFLRGIGELIRGGTVKASDVRVELIGDCETADGVPVRRVVSELGLDEVVRVRPQLPYPEALAEMAAADVLLLFAQGQPEQIPAKLYEYLHVNRFVLGFTSGASARLIHESGSGRVVESEGDIKAALTDVLALHRSGELSRHRVSKEMLRPYQARHLAGVLAKRLERVTLKSRRGRTCKATSEVRGSGELPLGALEGCPA